MSGPDATLFSGLCDVVKAFVATAIVLLLAYALGMRPDGTAAVSAERSLTAPRNAPAPARSATSTLAGAEEQSRPSKQSGENSMDPGVPQTAGVR